MKAFLVFLLFVSIVWGLLFFVKRKDNTDILFLDKYHTDIMKGYAILGVLIGHIGQYSGVNGIEFPAGVGVSIFLILSGYGLAVSTKKSGLKGYWGKRALRVLLPYLLAQAVVYLVTMPKVSFVDVLLDYTLIMPRHEFGWYLRYILVCYIIYFFVFLLIKKVKYQLIALASCFAVWFIIRSTVLIDPTPFLQARQMIAFPIGVLASFAKMGGEKKLWLWSIISILSGIAVYGLSHTGVFNIETMPLIVYNLISLFTVVPSACGLIILVYLVRLLQNKGLVLLSAVTYEIYIVHGYFMHYISHDGSILNLLIFIVYVSAGTLLLHFSVRWINVIIRKMGDRKRA